METKHTFTAIRLIEMVTKTPKYYTHAKPAYKASTAFRIVAAIKAGTCKPDTEKAFFEAFGYKINTTVTYVKNEL